MEKPFSPSCERNQEAIYDVLKDYVTSKDNILELGSGTGQHAVYLGQKLNANWQCSDREENIAGIKMWLVSFLWVSIISTSLQIPFILCLGNLLRLL